jgi:hypothetical protein
MVIGYYIWAAFDLNLEKLRFSDLGSASTRRFCLEVEGT